MRRAWRWGVAALVVVGHPVAGGAGPAGPSDLTAASAVVQLDLAGSSRVLGAFGSYGGSQRINGSTAVDIATFGGRWSRLGAPRSFGLLSGRPALALEALPLVIFDQEPRPYAVGFNVLLEHRLSRPWPVLPIVRFGVGAIASSHPVPSAVPSAETRLNFSVLAGVGCDIPWRPGRALSIEYRLHHVSNANRGEVNPGINTHTLLGGISWYRP